MNEVEERRRLVWAGLGKIDADLVVVGGRLVNVLTREIYQASVAIKGGRICAVLEDEEKHKGQTEIIDATGQFIVPGFIDPHMHVESSSLTIAELSRAIVPRGVTTIVEDPHEIANVLGINGIRLLFDEAKGTPLNLLLRVPGRVPALSEDLETSGGRLSVEDTLELLDWDTAVVLAGDINPRLILSADTEQLMKIEAAIRRGKTVSGQSPGLRDRALSAFAAAGPEDSHVSKDVREVIDILRHGLRALLTHRPYKFGAMDFRELAHRINDGSLDSRNIMLHTDDTHANQIKAEGHLDYRIKLAIKNGVDPVVAIQMATINVAEYLRIDRDYGSICPGRYADMAILDDLSKVEVDKVLVRGNLVAASGELVSPISSFEYPEWAKDTMHVSGEVGSKDMQIQVTREAGGALVRVIVPGSPKEMRSEVLPVCDGVVCPDPDKQISSIAVLDRHRHSGRIGKGFVRLAMEHGAFASTVNHDSHNIFVIGVDFEEMAAAVNRLIEIGGGYVAVRDREPVAELALPIAGLMSVEPYEIVAEQMENLERTVVEVLGCKIGYRPLYTLNFLCLPNVPNVGITDRGVLDSRNLVGIDVVEELCYSQPDTTRPSSLDRST